MFGGEVIAQALMAAYATVDGRLCHSVHAYFMRPGNPTIPIVFEVDRARVSCPLLSGPSTITVWIKEGTTNACQEAQA
ncbi:hypothetical protein CA235_19260 [Sphingomonas sp. ABOLF]|nr:hypothetical protein CA235_19260 [Sphingomonas sp. ABOLF]